MLVPMNNHILNRTNLLLDGKHVTDVGGLTAAQVARCTVHYPEYAIGNHLQMEDGSNGVIIDYHQTNKIFKIFFSNGVTRSFGQDDIKATLYRPMCAEQWHPITGWTNKYEHAIAMLEVGTVECNLRNGSWISVDLTKPEIMVNAMKYPVPVIDSLNNPAMFRLEQLAFVLGQVVVSGRASYFVLVQLGAVVKCVRIGTWETVDISIKDIGR